MRLPCTFECPPPGARLVSAPLSLSARSHQVFQPQIVLEARAVARPITPCKRAG